MLLNAALSRMAIFRVPLFRLLAINLAAGAAAAVLLLGGLLALNPHGLRDLILADRSPGTAIGLLLFGLFITFGSTAMGTAIMAMGGLAGGGSGNGGGRPGDPRPMAVIVRRQSPRPGPRAVAPDVPRRFAATAASARTLA